MTVSDVLWRTLLLFVVLHLAALVGIFSTIAPTLGTGQPQDVTAIPWMTSLICGSLIGMALTNKENSNILLIITFIFCEGWFLGGAATYFEEVYPGIALQVAFAVLSVVVAFLLLFAIVSTGSATTESSYL